MPDPDTATDAQWTDYVYNRNGAPGPRRECGITSQAAHGS